MTGIVVARARQITGDLSRPQLQIVGVAWITYAAFYLCRANLAIAIPAIQLDLGLAKSQIGVINMAYFWGYNVGLALNGLLGDRLSPRRFVLTGVVGATGVNLLFAVSTAWLVLVPLWFLSGFFGSMGWSPMLRVLANWLTVPQRSRISGLFATSFVVGNAATWILTGWLVANFGWRAAFLIPALLLLFFAPGWYLFVQDAPAESKNTDTSFAQSFRPQFALVRRYNTLLLVGIFLGFTFMALLTWLTTYYVEVLGLPLTLAAAMAALLPISGIFGTLFASWLIGRHFMGREEKSLLLILGALAGLFLVYPLLSRQLLLAALGLLLMGSTAYAATSVFLATLPLTLTTRQIAATSATFEFSFNMGAGVSGGIIGFLLDQLGWNIYFTTLATAALIALTLLLFTLWRSQRKPLRIG